MIQANPVAIDISYAIPANDAAGLPLSLSVYADRAHLRATMREDAEAAGGVGLLGMRERVAYYHGRIEFRSRPQAGMRIVLSLPIDDSTTAAGDGGRMTSVA